MKNRDGTVALGNAGKKMDPFWPGGNPQTLQRRYHHGAWSAIFPRRNGKAIAFEIGTSKCLGKDKLLK